MLSKYFFLFISAIQSKFFQTLHFKFFCYLCSRLIHLFCFINLSWHRSSAQIHLKILFKSYIDLCIFIINLCLKLLISCGSPPVCIYLVWGIYSYIWSCGFILISFKHRLGKHILKWLIILKLIVLSVLHALPLLTVWREWIYTPQFYMWVLIKIIFQDLIL